MTTSTILRGVLGCGLVVALFLLPAAVSAESLTIQYTGLDIAYDGSTITDAGNPDALSSLVFKVGGVEVPPVLTSGIAIDLSIPGVTGLPVDGGSTTSAAGGTLSLTLPDGDLLNLELGAADIYLAKINLGLYELYFALAASAAEVLSQSLPLDGELGGDVAVSFSTQIDHPTLTSSGGIVTGFAASGTGEIQGALVPEATTLALVLSGLVACVAACRHR